MRFSSLLPLALLVVAGCGTAPTLEPQPGVGFVADSGAPAIVDAGPKSLVREVRLEMTNEYAESLLSATGSLDGGTAIVFFSDSRFASGQVRSSAATMTTEVGQAITWSIASMSLGRRYTWAPFSAEVPDQLAPVYRIAYDYDLATANFVIHRSWKPGP